MKLVLTHTDLRLYWPARIDALVDALTPIGVQIHVIEFAGLGSPYAFAGASAGVARCPWEFLYPGAKVESVNPREAAAKLFRRLDELCPDIVLSGAIAYPSGATAVRWARLRRRAVVIMDDARIVDVPRCFLVNWIKQRIYANVDAVLAPAESWKGDFRFFGVPCEKLAYGVNAVDNEAIAKRAALARDPLGGGRSARGLPERFILGVGRQVEKKMWHTLIEAFASARIITGSPVELVLVGEGPERARLESLARSMGAPVTFLPFLDADALGDVYGRATGLVLPSRYGETWGLVVNEAMAAGLPVIVSEQCGCAATLVKPGENGWTFDPTKPGDLSSALCRLLELSGKDLSKMGTRSREIVSNWGLERFCSGVSAAIRYVAGKDRVGFCSPIDSVILRIWHGRYRPG